MPTIVLVFTFSFDVPLLSLDFAPPYLMMKLIDNLLKPTDN
jgi:hypothetical protein